MSAFRHKLACAIMHLIPYVADLMFRQYVYFLCRCQTLDSGADGYVRAEGCGTLMLQSATPTLDSTGTGNTPAVVAFMHATAVNQDGRSSSLTAPNGPSQQGVIRQALQAAALEPHQMHALQLHGTGKS